MCWGSGAAPQGTTGQAAGMAREVVRAREGTRGWAGSRGGMGVGEETGTRLGDGERRARGGAGRREDKVTEARG